ncbi:MAG: hypothetical protein LQ343_004275 [Gyalolechia ehrenbergii]|nr:MAG: hypothetical protein LQ343_004275 [Gyalolechia ehrenbergii]
MSEAFNHPSGDDGKNTSDSQTVRTGRYIWSLPNSPQPNCQANDCERSPSLLTRQQNSVSLLSIRRSSAPPQLEMDIDEPEGGDQQRELPQAIQANRYPAEDAAYSGREEQANDIEANEQINVQINGQPDAQPNGTQPNMGSQQDAPPSGQQSADREDVSVDPKESLEPFAWDDLEARFVRKMEECERREEEIEREFAEWCLVRRSSRRFALPYWFLQARSGELCSYILRWGRDELCQTLIYQPTCD